MRIIVGCGFNPDIMPISGRRMSRELMTHRETHVSTDELFKQGQKALPICIRREGPCHVKDILKKETY